MSGQKNCIYHFKKLYKKTKTGYRFETWILTEEIRKLHHEFSIKYEQHAEVNALVNAAKNGTNVNNADIYVSISPCSACAKMIITSGIKNVYYVHKYDNDEFGIKLLKENKINCKKI